MTAWEGIPKRIPVILVLLSWIPSLLGICVHLKASEYWTVFLCTSGGYNGQAAGCPTTFVDDTVDWHWDVAAF